MQHLSSKVAMGIGNIGWTEFLVILAIALIFFGPRRLPEIARAIGKSLREFRKALNEVRDEITMAETMPDRQPTPSASVSERPEKPEVVGPTDSGAESPANGAGGPNPDEVDSGDGDARGQNTS